MGIPLHVHHPEPEDASRQWLPDIVEVWKSHLAVGERRMGALSDDGPTKVGDTEAEEDT